MFRIGLWIGQKMTPNWPDGGAVGSGTIKAVTSFAQKTLGKLKKLNA